MKTITIGELGRFLYYSQRGIPADLQDANLQGANLQGALGLTAEGADG